MFFAERTAEAIAAAGERLDRWPPLTTPKTCRADAERFSAERFGAEIVEFIDAAMTDHRQRCDVG